MYIMSCSKTHMECIFKKVNIQKICVQHSSRKLWNSIKLDGFQKRYNDYFILHNKKTNICDSGASDNDSLKAIKTIVKLFPTSPATLET